MHEGYGPQLPSCWQATGLTPEIAKPLLQLNEHDEDDDAPREAQIAPAVVGLAVMLMAPQTFSEHLPSAEKSPSLQVPGDVQTYPDLAVMVHAELCDTDPPEEQPLDQYATPLLIVGTVHAP